MKFKVGDRVCYTSLFYGVDDSNPTHISGTVIEVNSTSCPIQVNWDNGRYNVYREEDLSLDDSPVRKTAKEALGWLA